MANSYGTNPMILDTTNAGKVMTGDITISGIVVRASNATWTVILKDGAGNVIFDASQIAGPISFSPAAPFTITGLIVDTLTNAKVYLYK